MKHVVSLAALAGQAVAWPFVLEEVVKRSSYTWPADSGTCGWDGYECPSPRTNSTAAAISQSRGNCGFPNPCTFFNAEEQLVSTTGEHAYQAPTAGQIRGPCPGLNAVANHGYFDRSGITNNAQTIQGLGEAYGMSVSIAAALAQLSIEQFGDPISQQWSIGGPVPTFAGAVTPPNTLTNVGISYAHNNYESDGSITRCDAALNNGDAHSVIVSRFAETYLNRLVPGRGEVPGDLSDSGYTLDSFAQDYTCKSQWSIDKNPTYVSNPLAGFVVAPAAFNFIINFMSNHSETNTQGWLSPSVFKSFFAIEGEYPNLKWNKGQERIPDNWYRRPSSTPYDLDGLVGDLLIQYAAYPDSARLGCNNGQVGTYVQGNAASALSELTTAGLAGFLPGTAALSNIVGCPGNSYAPRGPDQSY